MIRTDLSVDWVASPRIITIAAPSTEITIQDLHDTCRSIEAKHFGIDEGPLIASAGKEDLGGGVEVGLTSTLQNAVIAFEARTGPDWILCKISGGNLVAIDAAGVSIDPRYPTAFITVDRTASSSATTQGQSDIARMSFGEKITIDHTHGYNIATFAGDMNKLGNMEFPVDNFVDAVILANNYHFNHLYVKHTNTLSIANVEDMIICGTGAMTSALTIEEAANCGDVWIKDTRLSGSLDGRVRVECCMIAGINYFNGTIIDCQLSNDPIILYGTSTAKLLHCRWGMESGGLDPSVIDCNHQPTPLIMYEYIGYVKITNRTVDALSTINFNGILEIDASCTAGTFMLSGNGTVIDNSTGTCVVDDSRVVNKENISDAVWEENLHLHTGNDTAGQLVHDINFLNTYVYVDTELPVNGHGTSDNPFNNISDAVDYAEFRGWKQLRFYSDATLERTLKNFTIEGIGGIPTIDFNGQNVDKSEFLKVKLTGLQVGSVTCREVILLGGLKGANGVYKESGIVGDIALADGANCSITASSSLLLTAAAPHSIDTGIGFTNVTLNLRKYSGSVTIKNMDHVSKLVSCQSEGGRFVLDGTNTLGTVKVSGLPTSAVHNTSSIMIEVDGLFPTAQDNQEAVWGTDDAKKVIEELIGYAEKSGDELHVTIRNRSDNTISHEYTISADKRIRTPV